MLYKTRKGFYTVLSSIFVAGSIVLSSSVVAQADEPESDTVEQTVIENVEEVNEESVSEEIAEIEEKIETYNAAGLGPKLTFTDVNKKTVFYNEITQLADYGVTEGWKMNNGTRQYRPLANVNRDVVIVFLYRAMGSPAYTAPKVSPFSDVSTKNIFYKEISWAYDEGITEGWKMKNGTREFRPVQPVKRDAMAAFLMRAAGAKAPKASKSFADVKTSQPHAAAMTWMKNTGVSTGWKNGNSLPKYKPFSNTKRDAMAAFMVRWLNQTPPDATKGRKATAKEQADWTAYLPTYCQEVEIRNIKLTNPTRKSATFSASVHYNGSTGAMYYTLTVDGNLAPDSAPAKALMKHECGHVVMGHYTTEKGKPAFQNILSKGWPSSNTNRVENAADCFADQLGAVRETKNYKVGYGTVCNTAQKNVAKTFVNFGKTL